MKPWQQTAFGTTLGLLLAAIILLIISQPSGQPIIILPAPTPEPIIVHVSGEVIEPGVYTLPNNTRVADAIKAAGGLSANADTTLVNLASRIKDGDKIWIPALGDTAQRSAEIQAGSAGVIVNINTATSGEIETLPGIGEVKAEQIVTYRNEHGLFLSIDDLLNVPGIGPDLLERIRLLITLSD